MMNAGVLNNGAIKEYKKTMLDMLSRQFPTLDRFELEYVLDEEIKRNVLDHPIEVDNSYKKIKVTNTLLGIADYISSKQPIITPYGVMFARHGTVPNPIYTMIDIFINERDAVKKEMFKYPKGSPEFTKLNLVQLLHKLDANAYYGASGMYSSIYYNLYAAASVTLQGRSLISAAALLFESFLANNVPFGSMNELIDFIHFCMMDAEQSEYKWDDYKYLDHIPTVQETFTKIIGSCGFSWIPTYDEMQVIWDLLNQMNQYELNRLYYKNNLYEFCDNKYITVLLVEILCRLDNVFIDPNKVPDEVKDQMQEFKDLIFEYVYYPHQIVDRLDKMECIIRDVSIIQDTDSSIVSFDAWYRWLLTKCRGINMKIKNHSFDPIEEVLNDEPEYVDDYDFETDEIIEMKRYRNPIKIIPEDNLRYSIISIIANTVSDITNDYMYRYCQQSNAQLPPTAKLPKGGRCMMLMKNEFLFRRVLLTDAKKHYASIQELQEGNVVPEKSSLDVKGMEAFAKSTISNETKTRLKKILYEDILNTPTIDQVRIIRDIAKVEKDIYNSIQNGEKLYFKPAKVKSYSGYDDPMRIQGIKASLAYNEMHQEGTEALDMSIRNSIDIAKCEITPKNIEIIKDEYPDVYEGAMNLMRTNKYFATGIDAVAIPLNEPVPKWLLPFIRYTEIINDNVAKFPLEFVGIYRGNANNNSTNMISF